MAQGVRLVLSYDLLDGWDGEIGRETQEAGDICIHVVDSHCCTAKTNEKKKRPNLCPPS